MKFDPHIHQRRSIRLKGYDYTQPGAYFITLVTYGRECLFGEITGETMRLSPLGEIVQPAWLRLPSFFSIRLDVYVVMPNHFHGIIWLGAERTGEASAGSIPVSGNTLAADASPQPPKGTQPGSLGAILQNFKSTTTRRANQMDALLGTPLWQRNYYEHIIRNESELDRIRRYILHNPVTWAADQENPRGRYNLPKPTPSGSTTRLS